jgi:hypothetical protein
MVAQLAASQVGLSSMSEWVSVSVLTSLLYLMQEREVKLNIELYAYRTKTQYKNGCKEEKE